MAMGGYIRLNTVILSSLRGAIRQHSRVMNIETDGHSSHVPTDTANSLHIDIRLTSCGSVSDSHLTQCHYGGGVWGVNGCEGGWVGVWAGNECMGG